VALPIDLQGEIRLSDVDRGTMSDGRGGKLVASMPSTRHRLSLRIGKLTDGNDVTSIVGCPTLDVVHVSGQKEALAAQPWSGLCLIVFGEYAIATFFPNRSPTFCIYPASTPIVICYGQSKSCTLPL
jgi:hypothetical protein